MHHEFVEAKPQKSGVAFDTSKKHWHLYSWTGLSQAPPFTTSEASASSQAFWSIHTPLVTVVVFEMPHMWWKWLKMSMEIWVDGKNRLYVIPRFLADPQFVRSLQPWCLQRQTLVWMLRLPCQTLGLHAHLWWCLLSCSMLGKVSPRSNSPMSHIGSPSPHVCRERWTLNVAMSASGLRWGIILCYFLVN